MAKNILFLGAGAIIYKTGKTFVYELKGLGKEMPIVMWTFALASLSADRDSAHSGFVSKWYLAQGGLQPDGGDSWACWCCGAYGQRIADGGVFDEHCSDGIFPGKRF